MLSLGARRPAGRRPGDDSGRRLRAPAQQVRRLCGCGIPA
jgi:hypothetical protein